MSSIIIIKDKQKEKGKRSTVDNVKEPFLQSGL